MAMWSNPLNKLKLGHKIIAVGLLAALLPFLVSLFSSAHQNRELNSKITSELEKRGKEQMSLIAGNVLQLCRSSNEMLIQTVTNNQNVAYEVLQQKGGLTYQKKMTLWRVKNQLTDQTEEIKLPAAALGRKALIINRDPGIATPLVDEVAKLVGGTCTIFQRMNEEGDMLRIATNVINKSNQRAIGTYIPAKNPDGTSNAVIEKILRGGSYIGRAFVVDSWNTTCYRPLKDSRTGNIIGMLYVGIREDKVEAIRNNILATKVGKSGYVFVLGGKGNMQGRYIISRDGARDGENIYDSRDARGNLFIKDFVDKALQAGGNEIAFYRYAWKEPSDAQARYKITAITYFEPWDWVIGAGVYEDEYLESAHQMQKFIAASTMQSIMASIVVLFIAIAIAWFMGRQISRPVEHMCKAAQNIAEGDLEQTIDYRSNDEIGTLAEAFRNMIEYLKNIAAAADGISKGSFLKIVKPRSGRDALSISFLKMTKAISAIKTDIKRMFTSVLEGQLSVRADAAKHEGDFKNIIEGTNDMLDAVTGPLTIAAQSVDRISRGDIPDKITGEYKGDFSVLINNLNSMIDTINRIGRDIRSICVASFEGQFNVRSDASKYSGTFERIIKGLNDIMSNMTTTIMMASEKLSLISRGDIPPKITETFRGDFNTIKDSLNLCIDTINALCRDTRELSTAACDGNLEKRGNAAVHQGAYRSIVEGINSTLDLIVEPLREMSDVMQRVADRDLLARIKGDYKGDLAVLKEAVNKAVENLDRSMQQVNLSASSVANASKEIGKGSQNIAQGAAEQASSLEEISASMNEVSSMSQANAESANNARELTENTKGTATQSLEDMNRLSEAMKEIRESSDKTVKIVKVIDELAFQTNLLALNAAVEAARAGDSGRGFAVVAEEVRNLAIRSAEAAKNTSQLLEESTKKVHRGETLNMHVMKSFQEINGQIIKVNEITEEIALSSEQQKTALNQINYAVEQMNQTTQQNAATAEESASTSQELDTQAQELKELVASFKIGDETSSRYGSAAFERYDDVMDDSGFPGREDRGHNGGNGHNGGRDDAGNYSMMVSDFRGK